MSGTEADDWLTAALHAADLEGQRERRLEELRQQDLDTELRTFTQHLFTTTDD